MSDEHAKGAGGSRAPRLALGVAYGVVAGGALGSVLLALTGNAIWLAFAPGIGLTVGLMFALLTEGSDASGRDEPG